MAEGDILSEGAAGVVAAITPSTAGYVLTSNGAGSAASFQVGSAVAGTVVQVVNTETGAVNTGTTTVNIDDTIPQQSAEGTEFMSLAITPQSATNKLKIEVDFQGAIGTASRSLVVMLFKDSAEDAIAVASRQVATANTFARVTFTHYMTAGGTSSTTFKVKAGCETSGTITFNGASGNRFFGGVFASSITITEIKV